MSISIKYFIVKLFQKLADTSNNNNYYYHNIMTVIQHYYYYSSAHIIIFITYISGLFSFNDSSIYYYNMHIAT